MQTILIAVILAALGPVVALANEPVQQPSLQALIDQAIADERAELVIPPGTYRLAPPRDPGPHLTIKGARDLKIVATGVNLVCTTLNRAVHIEDSHNLTLVGLTIDYDPLPFTQGVIIGQADDGSWLDIRLDEGYPDIADTARGIIYDPQTRRVKRDTWTRYSANIIPQGQRVVRLDGGRPLQDAVQVGDLIALTGRTRSPHGILLMRCKRTILEDVTIHAATSFAVLENFGHANTYRRLRITPGPTPTGATSPRLLSSNADGIHSKHASRGPTIEDSLIEQMGDDGIAINGDFALIVRQESATRIVVSPKRTMPYEVGDHLRVFNRSLVPSERATITAIDRLPQDPANDGRAVQQQYWPDFRERGEVLTTAYLVTLDRPLSVEPGYLVSSPDRTGSGFVIRNNQIKNHRARGILVKSSDGVIEGNTIDGSSMAAIALCPEPRFWMEAGFSENVVIRNNTLRDTGYAARNVGSIQAGAISVVAEGPSPAGGHRNITIEGNTIEDAVGSNIVITSADGVTIRNNRFIRPGHHQPGTGSRFGVDGKRAIHVSHSQNVIIEDNKIEGIGPFMHFME